MSSTTTVRTRLLRPDDLLHLQVEGLNMRLDSRQGSPVLVVKNPDEPAYLRVVFSSQTIAETAVFEVSDFSGPGDVPVEPLFGPGLPGKDAKTVAQLAHPSRLVFKVPPQTEIPFSTEGLLDWTKLELSVNGIAAIGDNPTSDQIAKAPAIAEPTETETAIELPYRLIISPTAEVAWLHRTSPFTSRGQTELWHTRLALKLKTQNNVDEQLLELSADQPAPLRAIWSPDFDSQELPLPRPDPDLGRTAMGNNDRHQIVVLTSAFHGYVADYTIEFPFVSPFALGPRISTIRDFGTISLVRTGPFVPQPFHTTELMLSTLGGWLRSRGHWDPLPRPAPPPIFKPPDFGEIFKGLANLGESRPVERIAPDIAIGPVIIPGLPQPSQSLDLSEWVHIAAQGRDHYVRIVHEGELWPFRNRAALIQVTERKFEEKNGIVVAYLMQRMFIVVREPEKTFATQDFGNPFKRVRLTTLVTPDIAQPELIGGTNNTFWVKVFVGAGSTDFFRFHAVGNDVEANTVDFTVPMLFVSVSDLTSSKPLDEYNAPVNAPADGRFRACIVPGQKVAFAPASKTQANENTYLATETLNFVMDDARVQPTLLKATVRIPQVRDLLGADLPTTIRLFPGFVRSAQGLDDPANKTGVFAQVVDDNAYTAIDPNNVTAALKKLQVDIHADQAGGFATPSLGVATLSRALGPLAGDVSNAVADTFNPAQFFPKDGTQLFGAFDLLALLGATSASENAPKMHTAPEGSDLVTRFEWNPKIGPVEISGIAAFKPDDEKGLTVNGTIRKPINPPAGSSGDVTAEFTGTLKKFHVSVLDSVLINFVEFSFTKKSKEKPDVTVQLDPGTPVEFTGDLKFIEEIRDAIPPGLFGDGPSLDLLPTGIRAGFAFALPPLTVGVFALKDVKLDAGLTLPFIEGKPVFDFNISERPHPFLLTVAIFGGGGFFHLQLDTAGMKELEVALEFGAAAALDIGVASGEVHVMAGIYFSLQRKENTTQLAAVLSGYLRMGGSLNVLGLVKISVEFNLSFTYDSGRDKAYGRATLTVQVEVLFFSTSVELTVERAFGGSGDPHFIDFFPKPEPWEEYALAFA